jgi:hypothetical protein
MPVVPYAELHNLVVLLSSMSTRVIKRCEEKDGLKETTRNQDGKQRTN